MTKEPENVRKVHRGELFVRAEINSLKEVKELAPPIKIETKTSKRTRKLN